MLPTIDPRSNLESLRHSLLFTLVRLTLDPRLQAFVAGFEQLQTEWWDIYKHEQSLLDDQMAAKANVEYTDMNLDETSDGVAAALLLETGNNRKAPLFTRYFGSMAPSRFRRPLLGSQLEAMRTWPESLKESKIPALMAYGETLVTQIAAADEAVKQLSMAEQKLKDSRMVGSTKSFFDKVNGARKQLNGDVSKMLHEHPEWSLGRDYVAALFEHETAPPELSNAEIDQKSRPRARRSRSSRRSASSASRTPPPRRPSERRPRRRPNRP